MLLITFVASAVKRKDFDDMRNTGSHIIPANMVGSRLRTEKGYEDRLEINCAMYSDDPKFVDSIKQYEQHIRKYDPDYLP